MKTDKVFLQVWLLCLLLLPSVARAQFDFVTNDDDTITITNYTGSSAVVVIPAETNGYPVANIGINAFFMKTNVSTVTISTGVTSIEGWAFSGCWNLSDVTIPNSVTDLGFNAFFSCINLTNITIPGSVMTIQGYAFEGCSELTVITISNGVTTIEDSAFNSCDKLTNIFIPQSVTNIASTAFSQCFRMTNITVDPQNSFYSSLGGVLFNKNQTTIISAPEDLVGSYTIPDTVDAIESNAFFECMYLTNVIIPSGVADIGQDAFEYDALTNITMPESVTNIGTQAFFGCENITSVIIPTNVISIGNDVFGYTGITNIIIPASVTNIQPGALIFTGITNITVNAGNPCYSSLDGVLFNFDQTEIVEFPPGGTGNNLNPGSYSIPGGVTQIGDSAFQFCSLNNIVIPDGVTNIGNDAFAGCSSLTNIVIPNTVLSIGISAFNSSSITKLIIPASVMTMGEQFPSVLDYFFEGNAPVTDAFPVHTRGRPPTAYYLPGTTGWTNYSEQTGYAIAPWLPQAQTVAANVNAQAPFNFNINWASGQTVVVEATTNLTNPDWQPVWTNTLATGSTNFTDPQWTNYPGRYYRLRSP